MDKVLQCARLLAPLRRVLASRTGSAPAADLLGQLTGLAAGFGDADRGVVPQAEAAHATIRITPHPSPSGPPAGGDAEVESRRGRIVQFDALFVGSGARMAARIPAGVRFVRMAHPVFGIQMGYRFASDSRQRYGMLQDRNKHVDWQKCSCDQRFLRNSLRRAGTVWDEVKS